MVYPNRQVMYDVPNYVHVPAGAEKEEGVEAVEDVPLEGVAPPVPTYKMEGPAEKFFTPPTSPLLISDEMITQYFDELCVQENGDPDDQMVGEIWSQTQFSEAELLWSYALDEVPSPTAEEEKALMAYDECLEE